MRSRKSQEEQEEAAGAGRSQWEEPGVVPKLTPLGDANLGIYFIILGLRPLPKYFFQEEASTSEKLRLNSSAAWLHWNRSLLTFLECCSPSRNSPSSSSWLANFPACRKASFLASSSTSREYLLKPTLGSCLGALATNPLCCLGCFALCTRHRLR